MNVQQAILLELFPLVLVAFGGFYWLAEPGNSFQWVVNVGIIVGVIAALLKYHPTHRKWSETADR